MNTVQEKWDEYLKVAVPSGASKEQLVGTKRAFYAGVVSTLHIQLDIAELNLSENEAVGALHVIYEECKVFIEKVDKGLC